MERRIAELAGRPLFWLAVVSALFSVPLARGLSRPRPPPAPPVLAAFPAFSLPDDTGRQVVAADLRGVPFVAGLLCARCVESGPLAAEAMRRLQHRTRNLGDALRLVSFSADGDPAALHAIRALHGGSRRWLLLAGAPPEVLAAFPREGALLLVDAGLRIRGVYDAASSDAIDLLLRDAMLVSG